MTSLVNEAIGQARKILSRNITPLGMMASCDVYQQVWARDSVITLLGATVNSDATALECLRVSLDTLAKGQNRFGQIPGFVACKDGMPTWGGMDCNPWFVLGVARLYELRLDESWRRSTAPAVIRALDWCESMDLSRHDLMISPEMFDWADLLANHGHVLYPNVLYAAALARGAEFLSDGFPDDAERFRKKKDAVLAALQDWFWVKDPNSFEDKSHHQIRRIMACHLRRRPYFLPWIDEADYGEYFDTTGNLLSILCDVASREQSLQILDFIDQVGVNRPYPVQVLYPAIQPGERNWREYYKIYNLNLPHQYHNRGIWPWVGGLYVAALVKVGRTAKAEEELDLLAKSNRESCKSRDWEFNEWLQGHTGRAMGSASQAWSAGMFLYAANAVAEGNAPGFGIPKDS